MPNTYTVVSAIYGAVNSSSQCSASDVSTELQTLLDQGYTTLCISNGAAPLFTPGPFPPFADPAPGLTKGFAAIVNVNGEDWYFACSEGGTIDFSLQPNS